MKTFRAFQNLSLSIKLNSILIVSFVILTIVIAAYASTSIYGLVSSISGDRLAENINITSILLEQRENEILEDTRLISRMRTVADAIQGEVSESTVRSVVVANLDINLYQSVVIFDTNQDQVFARIASGFPFTPRAFEEQINVALLGVETVEILPKQVNGETQLIITAFVPIFTSDNTPIGAVVVERAIDAKFLESLILDRDFIYFAVIYRGDYLISTYPSALPETLLANPAVGTALRETLTTLPDLVQLNSPTEITYIPLTVGENTPAVLLMLGNIGEFTAFQQQFTLSLIIILPILGVIMAGFVLVFVRQTISKRILQLNEVAGQLAIGDYSVRAEVESADEIAVLSIALNFMADTVEERERNLNELNQSLEQRVVDRTRELKTARDEALAAQRIANENSRLKSEFLSMMSHELRTPMNAIEGFTGIMLKRMAGVDFNDKAERYLTKVQANSRRLLGLINDFLDLSRIESGRLELANLPMSPTELAEQWQNNLSVLADNKNLDFKVTVDPNLPETIIGDAETLSKIAINLLGNAIKFTEAGSVSLTLSRQDDEMEMVVRDTGIGIPAHARDFIFDEFRQVDQSSKRQHGGTGLGLSIVQKLARAMGGTVALQSEVGVGSTFIVRLPIVVEEEMLEGVS